MLEIKVLGTLEIARDGSAVELPTAMLQRLAALLSCRTDRPMSTDALIEGLWQDKPPTSARKTLLVYVHRLRQLLGEGYLERGPSGYRLDPAAVSTDSALFTDLTRGAEEARLHGQHDLARKLLSRALYLWRGPAYSGIEHCAIVREQAGRLA